MNPFWQTVLTAFLTGGGCSIILWLMQRYAQKKDEKQGVLRDIRKAIDDIKREIADLKREQADAEADHLRDEILRFDGELTRDVKHTPGEFAEAIRKVDKYQDFCRRNPAYPNTKAETAIGHIKSSYKDRVEKRDYV